MTAISSVSSVSSISLSGMQAAQTRLQSSAHNIANAQTESFHRQRVVQASDPHGGVTTSITRESATGEQLTSDVVEQIQAKSDFMANLKVFKSSEKMLGSLLDIKA